MIVLICIKVIYAGNVIAAAEYFNLKRSHIFLSSMQSPRHRHCEEAVFIPEYEDDFLLLTRQSPGGKMTCFQEIASAGLRITSYSGFVAASQ